MGDDGSVRTAPVRELEALRGERRELGGLVAVDEELSLDGAVGDSLALLAHIDRGSAPQVGLKFRRSPDGAEQTVVQYDRSAGEVVLDVAQASADDSLAGLLPQCASLTLGDGEPLVLRALLDAR